MITKTANFRSFPSRGWSAVGVKIEVSRLCVYKNGLILFYH